MTTKDQILEVGFQLFLDKGYKNTSMSDLMQATQLSKGAFYHYFASKEVLYQEVIDRYFLAYYQSVDFGEIELSSIADVEEAIKGFYLAVVPEIILLSPKGLSRYFILFFEAYDSYPKYRVEVRKFYEALKETIRAVYILENSNEPEKDAIRMIAKYEGLLFWLAIYPEKDAGKMIADF